MLLKIFFELAERWSGAFDQQRTQQRALLLALGLVCGVGRRTVTRALGFLGRTQRDWSADYRFFSRSAWDPKELFEPILEDTLSDYMPQGLIAVALDDTGVPRNGKKISSASWQRDPMSPPFHTNLLWGQRFLQTSLLVPLYRQNPQSSPRALPIGFTECPVVKKPSKKATDKQRAAYRQAKKKHNLSQQFVSEVRELRARLDRHGMAQRLLLATGDGSYCNRTTFRAQWERTSLLCRTRKDLRLCFPHQGNRSSLLQYQHLYSRRGLQRPGAPLEKGSHLSRP